MKSKNPYNSKNKKYESCVRKIKTQRGYNPYAVCRSSIYKTKSKDKEVFKIQK